MKKYIYFLFLFFAFLLVGCGESSQGSQCETEKRNYDMSGISFESKQFEYDGLEHFIEIEGDLPEGVEVSYVGNGKIDIGTYEVIAVFTGDYVNYNQIPNMTANIIIFEKISEDSKYIGEYEICRIEANGVIYFPGDVDPNGVIFPEHYLPLYLEENGKAITTGIRNSSETGISYTKTERSWKVVDGKVIIYIEKDCQGGIMYELIPEGENLVLGNDDLKYIYGKVQK